MASLFSILVSTPFLISHYFFDVVRYVLPWGRPVKQWTFSQAVRVRTVKLLLLYISLFQAGDKLKLEPGRERNRFETIHPSSPALYKGPMNDVVIHPETIGATWTPARPPQISHKTTVVLHFHGGAFVIGNGRDSDTGYLSRTLVRYMGCTHVCTPQYRLSSSKGGQFPAALQDALTSYLHLIKELGVPASQLILSGDSAGGNLALALLRYISEYGHELEIPAPAAVALWSPWTDVGAAMNANVNMRLSPNYSSDYLNADFAEWGATTITSHGAIDASGPYLSPLHHPFKMSSEIPLFVNGGDREVLYDDIKAFSRAYSNEGWPLHLTISKGCPHDILLLGPRMGFHKDAEAAVRDAKAFFSGTTKLYLGES